MPRGPLLLSDEERARRSDLAKRLIREGKLGGAEAGRRGAEVTNRRKRQAAEPVGDGLEAQPREGLEAELLALDAELRSSEFSMLRLAAMDCPEAEELRYEMGVEHAPAVDERRWAGGGRSVRRWWVAT